MPRLNIIVKCLTFNSEFNFQSDQSSYIKKYLNICFAYLFNTVSVLYALEQTTLLTDYLLITIGQQIQCNLLFNFLSNEAYKKSKQNNDETREAGILISVHY
jgi:hypothetical protein